jgi:hypothetical protein
MADCKIPEILTPRETATARRTTTGHLANERSRGLGPPFVKLGGRVFYPAEQLRDYITSRIHDPSDRTTMR